MNMQSIVDKVAELGATWGLKLVGVLAALVIGFIVANWVRGRIRAVLERRKFDPTLTRFFANLARYGILTGVVLGCMGVFGIETTSFAAIIGAAGLAVGLAFQGTLSSFSAGVMLLIFRPFKVGDFVTVAGVSGTVDEIELFTTAFKTVDNRKVIVPNGAIFGSTIDNVTHHPLRRVDIDVGCDNAADIDRCREVLEKMEATIPGVLADPAPEVFLKSIGAPSVDWQVRVWCKTEDYWSVWQATTRATKKALDAAGIGMPCPQMQVHVDRTAAAAPRAAE